MLLFCNNFEVYVLVPARIGVKREVQLPRII